METFFIIIIFCSIAFILYQLKAERAIKKENQLLWREYQEAHNLLNKYTSTGINPNAEKEGCNFLRYYIAEEHNAARKKSIKETTFEELYREFYDKYIKIQNQ